MADLAKLTVRLEAETSKLRSELKKTNARMGRWEKKTKASLLSVKKAFMGLASAAAAVKLVASIGRIGIEFQKLRASLTTVTGSAELANHAFKQIQDFASTTPFAVAEVTNAFIKLKAMGLDPSQRALTSYGNTAGAMGKSLNQMIEAVADAATFEFERLKEFGIKARQQGDKVTLTFRGVSKTIEKESRAIQEYLLQVGETEFAGGMERQSKTLGGALSNLGDSWDNFIDRLGNTGPIGTATEFVTGLSNAIERLSTKLFPDAEKQLQSYMDEWADLNSLLENPKWFTNIALVEQRRDYLAGEIKRLLEEKRTIQAALAAAEAAEAKAEAAKAAIAAAKALEEANKALTKSEEDHWQSLIALSQMHRDYAKSAKEAADAQRELHQAALDSVDPFSDFRKEMLDLELALELYPEMADEITEKMLALEDGLKGKTKEASDIAKELGMSFSSAFEDAIVGGKSLSEVLKGLEQDIIRIITRQLVTKPFASAISSFAGGLDLDGLFGGARAMGGPVMAGTPYLVGEKGPELMIPNSSGTIVPNNAIGGVQVHQVNNFGGGPASRQTQQQLSDAAYRGARAATARNS